MSMSRRQRAFARKPDEQAAQEMRNTYLITNRIGNTVPTDSAHAERVIQAILRRNKEQKKRK